MRLAIRFLIYFTPRSTELTAKASVSCVFHNTQLPYSYLFHSAMLKQLKLGNEFKSKKEFKKGRKQYESYNKLIIQPIAILVAGNYNFFECLRLNCCVEIFSLALFFNTFIKRKNLLIKLIKIHSKQICYEYDSLYIKNELSKNKHNIYYNWLFQKKN